MNRFINDKIGRKSKKHDLENHPLETQLKLILSKFEDPIEAVRSIIDPDHKNIVKSDLRVAPPRPTEPTKGVFRVIYSTSTGRNSKVKIKSMEIEASNGRDAKFRFDLSCKNETNKALSEVISVECLYVPRSIKNDFLQQFSMENEIGVVTPLVELAWENLIEELEVFQDQDPENDLSKFINDK